MSTPEPATAVPASPTIRWIENTIAASGSGARTPLRTVQEAWDAREESRDPVVPQQTVLPSASKSPVQHVEPPRRIVNAFDPPESPTRYVRVYTADGECRLVPESDADESEEH